MLKLFEHENPDRPLDADMTCQPSPTTIMQGLVDKGLMEPCIVLDANCNEVRGYRPTAAGQKWFGELPPLSMTVERFRAAADRRSPTIIIAE